MQTIVRFAFFLGCINIFLIGCIDQDAYENTSLESGQSIAIPLIDSKVGISSLNDKVDNSNTSVKIDENGKLTVFYDGEVLRQTSRQLFPAVPGISDFPLIDTNVFVPLPIDPKYKIRKATFGKTRIFFNFREDLLGDYSIKVSLPQTNKNNQSWSYTFDVTFDDDSQDVFTSLQPLFGWEIYPDANSIQFVYEAYGSDGKRVKLDYAAMRVDQLVFDYMEGYFAYQVFDIQGSDIGIGLFESWESGGIIFDDPKMNITVENSMGFPVQSKVNYVTLNTLSNGSFDLESEFIDKGINFDYPSVNEVGVTKYSGFSFDKDNSNIKELFADKVINVGYDIDAIANPDQDTTIVNFVDSTSFFSVKVAIEIPLLGSINDFVLTQKSDTDLSQLEDAKSATFKSIITNDFPTDILVQMYFTDTTGMVYDSLFEEGFLEIASAPLGADLKTTTPVESINFTEVDEAKMANILKSQRVETKVSLDNTEEFEGNLWIYDEYKLHVKLGATIQIK